MFTNIMKIIIRLLCIMLVIAMPTGLFAQDYWTQKANFGGGTRYGATGISIGDKGYMGLGVDESGYHTDFWEYDPASDLWTQVADFEGSIRSHATGFTIGNKGYVGTGAYTPGDVDWVWHNDLWEYDPQADSWTQKASFDALGRNNAVGFSINGKGYIGTGTYRFNRFYDAQYLDDFWEYDPVANAWQQKANVPEQGRTSATGIRIGNKGYVGLGVYYYDTRLKDWWEFDPLLNTWTRKTDLPGIQRVSAAGFSIGEKGYIGTGAYYSFLNDFWEFNPATDSWCRKADFPLNVYGAAVFQIGSKAYVGTGGVGPGFSAEFFEYTSDALNVVIPDTYAVNPGGDPNTIYIGYGPASVTLTTEVTGGTPNPDSSYQYLWDDGSGLSTLTVGPELAGTYNYSVTVTDANGCTDTGEKTIAVSDIRCGAQMDKVLICMTPPGHGHHNNARTLCINPNAVPFFLNFGSQLGACNEETPPSNCIDVRIFPNPNHGVFNVQVSDLSSPAEITVTDRHGKIIVSRMIQASDEPQTVNIDLGNAPRGLYFVRIKSGNIVLTRKLFVLK